MSKFASDQMVRVGILGASGYTGADLVRLLAGHERTSIELLTANTQAGQPMDAIYPHLANLDLPGLITVEEADWDSVDVLFCGLPHGTTQKIIAGLPHHLRIIDLSADFRLMDVDTYSDWYGHEHCAPKLQQEAVYGLTEMARDAIRSARLVACPGCYPTAALLHLVPLVNAGLIDADDIIIDAKSGVTGAGRAVKQEMLFAEVAEGIHPYAISNHRHAPEMEQELSVAAGRKITINFTPHLMPMNRGELLTSYVRLVDGATADIVRSALQERFADEPFVRVVPEGITPATRHVRGSNYCLMGVFSDRIPGRVIVVTVIDNLVKGSSGQAVQNMNVMLNMPESTGLEQQPLFP